MSIAEVKTDLDVVQKKSDSQDVPYEQKMKILQNLRDTGCRFRGDLLDLNNLTLKEMRGTIGRKMPWLFIDHTVNYINTLTKNENVSMYLKGMMDCTMDIGRTFVVNVTEDGGRIKFNIGWTEEMKPFFVKTDGKTKGMTRYKVVTKDQVIQWCNTVFETPMMFPKVENYPKEWFVAMLVLRSAYSHDNLDDGVLTNAQDMLKKRVVKKEISIRT
jgi:hypothetical protein